MLLGVGQSASPSSMSLTPTVGPNTRVKDVAGSHKPSGRAGFSSRASSLGPAGARTAVPAKDAALHILTGIFGPPFSLPF